jgi:phosphoglycerate dehydrogenase-like enzyme
VRHARADPLLRNVIERLPNLKLIASTGPGNAAIDVAAAGEHGIAVVPTGYTSGPAIELTWALILASARHVVTESNSVRSGGWQQTVGTDFRGKTLGVHRLTQEPNARNPLVRIWG